MERGCPYLYTGSKVRVIWPSVLIIQGGLQQPPVGKYVWGKPSGQAHQGGHATTKIIMYADLLINLDEKGPEINLL